MNTNLKLTYITGLVVALLAVPLGAMADTVLHGRISFDAGGTLLKGVSENDWSNGAVNTLVLEGDTVWVDNGGTTEIEFSGGSFLRMADGSKAEIAALPPSASIRGWTGSFYVQRLSRSHGDFVFYSPAGIVAVEKDSSVRIDVLEGGLTTVTTRWGRASIRTEAGGEVQAHAGRRVYIEAGLLPSQPTPFDRAESDAFDDWNRERAEFLATGSTRTPSSVKISDNTLGTYDLDRYGEWVYVDNRPCWRPTVVVDYTPYRYGYWNHVSSIGSVWVGNYPFSYITSHHGYWDYHGSYGWIWSYEPRWSPAYCATVRYGDYFVWSPINRYYRPVYPTTTAYFSIGGVSFGYWGTSYAHVNHLYSGPSYVSFAYNDVFRRYYSRGNVTVNIWNINSGNRAPSVRVPYNDSLTTVRDYTPRRSIRGASTFLASGATADQRVQRLEASSGRQSFSRAERTGGDFVRTASTREGSSRLRTARIDQSAPSYTRATRESPVRAGSTTSRSSASDRENGLVRTGTPRNTLSRTNDSRNVSGRTSVLRGESDRSSATRDSNGRTSSIRGTTPQRTDIDPRGGGDSFDSRTRVTTYTRTPSRTTSRERTAPTTRSSDRESMITRTPTTSRSDDSGSRSAATSSRGLTRTTIPSTASRTRTEGPSDLRSSSRTPSRSYSGPQTTRPTVNDTPSRDITTRTQSPSRSVTSRPSAPSRSVTSRPSEPSRSAAPRPSAPSRSVAPRPSAPSRSVTPRSVAPSPSRVSPPSRSTSSGSRSMTTAPSRQSNIRSVAPSTSSRSTAGRASISSPSRGSASTGRSVSRSRGLSSRGR